MDRKISLIILTVILVIGAFLRFFWLAKSPPALNWDEAALGYNAFSILETGKDEFGKVLPISLRSFDDYKPALYAYAAVPFVKLLGLNEISVRLPSALAGILLILTVYFLTDAILRNRKIAAVSALLIAIEPWSVHFSRAAFEANLALLLFTSGLLLVIKSKFQNFFSLFGFIFIALSAYTYHSEKILILPTVAVLLFIYRKNIRQNRKVLITSLVVLTLILLPLIWQSTFEKQTFSRLGSTLLISNATPARYLSYFSPVNLFTRGTPEPTQAIPNFGMFYPFEIIFWLVGLVSILRKARENSLLIFLLLLFPLPAAITWNWFYPARVLPLFALFSIITAYGVYILMQKIGNFPSIVKVLTYSVAFLIVFIYTANLATTLLFYLPYQESGNWQYGMKQIVEKTASVEKNYTNVVVETKTAQPYIFFLFYSKYPPEIYQKEVSQKPWIASNRTEFNFGRYIFRDVYWPKDQKSASTLLVGSESSLPKEEVKSNPNVNYAENITDFYGNVLAKVVGLK